MRCTCILGSDNLPLVKDPWCPWHGTPGYQFGWVMNEQGEATGYSEPWPTHFNCRCIVSPITGGPYDVRDDSGRHAVPLGTAYG